MSKYKTLGKVAGGLGALLLLSTPVTYLIAPDATAYWVVKLLVAVAFVVTYFVTHWERFAASDAPRAQGLSDSAKTGFFLSSTVISGVLVVGLAVAFNFIVARRGKTWDLTSKKIHSLAPQTVTALKELKQPVTAIGFLPAKGFEGERAMVEQLFKRYRDESDKFTYTFKDPNKEPELTQKYQLKQNQGLIVVTLGDGPMAPHATVSMPTEQELTNTLLKLSSSGTQKVYFLSGHGEVELPQPAADPRIPQNPNALNELRASLQQEGYAAQPLNLVEQGEIPADAAVLVIAGARGRFAATELAALEKYLEAGGRLLYFAELNAEPGLSELLQKYAGVRVEPGVVVDTQLTRGDPFSVLIPFFGEHEMTRLLRMMRVAMEFIQTRGLALMKEGLASGVTPTVVATTGPSAWIETDLSQEPQLSSGERSGQIPVVIAASRDTKAAADKRQDESRVVVFGDTDLLVDQSWGYEPNRNLVLNALAWASNQAQKITIRPPDRDISTLDLDKPLFQKLRFISMDLIPMLLMGFGLGIWLSRRSR